MDRVIMEPRCIDGKIVAEGCQDYWILQIESDTAQTCYYTFKPLSRWVYLRKHNDIHVVVFAGLILCLRTANERGRYFVTMSLIGWAQT